MINTAFIDQTTLIEYNAEKYARKKASQLETLELGRGQDNTVRWLNTYGIHFHDDFKALIQQNKLDDFLIKLLLEMDRPNQVIQLEGLLFISIKVLKTEGDHLDEEQMIFIASGDFVWSIQEKQGDYFDWIRDRLENNKGLLRKKKADYLLFFLLESIIDNYLATFEKLTGSGRGEIDVASIKPTPEFTAGIEKAKRDLFLFKRAAVNLRDAFMKMEKVENKTIKSKYFAELREQARDLIADIEYEVQAMESMLNMVYSVQGYRLNEVMKTLTIFSVIFIPLTFLAGIYGMNFTNMPELETENGYFILLIIMFVITVFLVTYILRKRWF